METWLEVLDEGGDTHFLNPAHIVAIVLLGDKEAARGATVETVRESIAVHDPASVDRLRRVAFTLAGLAADGTAQRTAATPPATRQRIT